MAQEEVVKPVKKMTMTSRRDAFARKYPGKVRAHKRVDLAFQVDGTLIELSIEEGQNAKAGDLLARVDLFPGAISGRGSVMERKP